MGTMLFRMDQPVELVREIVYNLPEELFQSDKTTFLDPAMGKGDYLVGIAQRLKEYGHSKENILSRLYGFECNAMYVQNCIHRTPLAGANITIKTYEEVLEWTPGMGKKFDVVIGNPPYQNDTAELDTRKRKGNPGRLFVDFVHLFARLSSTYAIIIPSTWMGRPADTINKMVLADQHVHRISDVTHHFKFLEGKLHVCAIHSSGNYTSDQCTMVMTTGDCITLNRESIRGFATAATMNIAAKIKSVQTLGDMWRLAPEIIREHLHDSGAYPVAEIVGKRDCGVPIRYVDAVAHPDKHFIHTFRVIVNVNASKHDIGQLKYIPPGIYVTQSLRFFPVASEVEATRLIAYLQSAVVRYVAHTMRSSNGNSKSFFSLIPQVDLTRSWTDEELYAHFNLTQEEIDLIESTVK